ncbi:MAG: hypothetical protein DRG80_04695, partial [Deltaproteobacteria bacterium]
WVVMLRQVMGLIIVSALFSITRPGSAQQLDAAQDGPIYGDPEGLARVAKLEQQLHNMHVREDHPRIFLCRENLPEIRKRCLEDNHYAWPNVKEAADRGDMLSAAFAYQIYKESNPELAQHYADIAIEKMKSLELKSGNNYEVPGTLENAALAFDWVYDAMSEEDRQLMINRIAQAAKFEERNNNIIGETFHIEEWCFRSYKAWPEIALAHHYPEAEEKYLERWKYTSIWGDAARAMAYIADGTDFEGYRYYASEMKWFLALKSATGINLIDSEDFPYFKMAGYYYLYRTDFGKKREFFHRWTWNGGGGGGLAYLDGAPYENAWVTSAIAKDPYLQWYIDQLPGSRPEGWYSIIVDPAIPKKDPSTASWDELPLSILFPGGNEVYMRTGWSGDDAAAALRVTPAWTMSSHGHSEANTFVLYRKGNLAMDSGMYDAYSGQVNYRGYQKRTTAHNDILVIDPEHFPLGEINVCMRSFTFSAPWDFRHGWKAAFVHRKESNWGDIVAYEAQPEFTYAVGEAARAYGIDDPTDPDVYYTGGNYRRLNEYYRSIVFIPKGTKAYFVVFDRIESVEPMEKRWLLHLVEEPQINGDKVSEEVPGHRESYDGDYLVSENGLGAALYLRKLFPENSLIKKIGGKGYEFWRGGENYQPGGGNLVEADISRLQHCVGEQGRIEEIGQWRIEIIPQELAKRDYFFNVMYLGDADETMAPVQRIEEGGRVGALIQDPEMTVKLLFNKEGEPGGHITIIKNGVTVVDKEFAGGVEPPPEPLNIITPSLPSGTVGTSYSYILSASGGTSPYTWSLESG